MQNIAQKVQRANIYGPDKALEKKIILQEFMGQIKGG